MMYVEKDAAEPVKDMKLNALYRLRPYHPSFDAVGIFEFNDEKVLLFMQFSTLEYSHHNSICILKHSNTSTVKHSNVIPSNIATLYPHA